MVEWVIKGKEFANCNCSYACPCQFSALPTHGNCCAAGAFLIDEGHYGKVKLDGLRAVGLYSWPKAVHEGNGTMQLIIDERADDKQRDALIKIMTGKDTKDMATMWWIYSAMCPNKLETLFKKVDIEVDVEGRRGRIAVDGILETVGEPIRNQVTGAEHRVRIDLPNGFEYRIAEIGSGTTKAIGDLKLDLKNSYSQFANLHLSHAGVVA